MDSAVGTIIDSPKLGVKSDIEAVTLTGADGFLIYVIREKRVPEDMGTGDMLGFSACVWPQGPEMRDARLA